MAVHNSVMEEMMRLIYYDSDEDKVYKFDKKRSEVTVYHEMMKKNYRIAYYNEIDKVMFLVLKRG